MSGIVESNADARSKTIGQNFRCRAWVNFDGTKDTSGTTSTANTNRLIRGSGNVASVLRNGTGSYTITFTTAMPDANYSFVGNTAWGAGQPSALIGSTTSGSVIQAGSLNVFALGNASDTLIDVEVVSVAIFR